MKQDKKAERRKQEKDRKLDGALDCAEVAPDNRESDHGDCAQALKIIMKQVDSCLYGNMFLESGSSKVDLVNAAEDVGVAAYKYMLDYHQRPEHISHEAITELKKAIEETLPHEKTREAFSELCSRLDWRWYFSTQGEHWRSASFSGLDSQAPPKR